MSIQRSTMHANMLPPITGQFVPASRVHQLFEKALSHNLKYPSISMAINSEYARAYAGPIVMKLAGNKSKNPGDIWVMDNENYPNTTIYGRITRKGEFLSYYKASQDDAEEIKFLEQVKALVASLIEDPVKTVIENAALTGYCCFCVHKLSDARSTKHGYGPICAKHYELPWDANLETNGLQVAEMVGA